jgi:WD40 repeat protein
MRSIKPVLFCLFLALVQVSVAQSVTGFPTPDAILADMQHKESKGGIELGPGNTITIKQGVGSPTTINVLAFSKDSKLLAAGRDFGRVVVWNVPERKFLCAVDTGQGIVRAVALSSDGQLMATGGEDDGFSIKLWHLPDGNLIRTYNYFNGYAHNLVFGADGTWIVGSDNASVTHVLDSTANKQLLELKNQFSSVLSPAGDILMTVDKANFHLWSTSDWKQTRTLPRSPEYAFPLALNPDSDSFIITSSGAFKLLRLSTGEVLHNLPVPELPKFNPAAGGFATFGRDNTIAGHSDDRLWMWDTGSAHTCVTELMYSESGALSPDGALLAGARDNSVLAKTRAGEGVWIWDTSKLRAKCFGTKE